MIQVKLKIKMPVCQFCKNVSFVHRVRLEEHEKDCPDRPKFQCSKCDKSFKYKQSLNKHFKNVHESPRKMLKCSQCNKECLDSRTLKNHIEIVHEGKNPFGCDVCKRVLGSKTALEGHKKIFCKGEKPFEIECPICNSKFNDQLEVQVHWEKAHHDQVFHEENSMGPSI